MRGKLYIPAVLSVLAVTSLWLACSRDDSPIQPAERSFPIEGDERADLFEWAIGPIEGITSVWHPAPKELTVPVGTVLRLKCGSPSPVDVHWVNARQTKSVAFGSIAEFVVDRPGRFEIRVDAEVGNTGGGTGSKKRGPSGTSSTLHECVVNGVATSVRDIGVRELKAWVDPLILTESASNYETMTAFYGIRYQIVSKFREVEPGHYRTAVKRDIRFDATATDSRFTSLIEARVPGQRPRLAMSFDAIFETPGKHTVSVGPTANPKSVVIETYEAVITNHESYKTIVPEGELVTFRAKTNPPGFEKEITWVSSTKFGRATPVLGEGPSFTVRFENTWGPHPENGLPFQWLGVRADNATFDQDTKCGDSVPYDGADHVVHTLSPPDSSVTIVSSPSNSDSVDLVLKDSLGNDLMVVRLAPGDGMTVTDGRAATACVRTPAVGGAACLAVNQATWTVNAPKNAAVDGMKAFLTSRGPGRWTYHVKNIGECPVFVRFGLNGNLSAPRDSLVTGDGRDFTSSVQGNNDSGSMVIFCIRANHTCEAEVTRVSVP